MGTLHRLADYRRGRKDDAFWSLYHRASSLDEAAVTLTQARDLYLEALAVRPESALTLTNLGNVYYRMGDHTEAAAYYRRALLADPECTEAIYNLGWYHLSREEHCLAIAYLRAATQKDPDFADAWYNLGMALDKAGIPREALEAFTRYLNTPRNAEDTWEAHALRHVARLTAVL